MLQDELSRELELQEKGLANNVGNKQAEVDGLLAEEARLMAEKEKIQKKPKSDN
jgi:plasmid maintenance system antidote protein VapI